MSVPQPDWLQPLSDVLAVLCQRGSITLRKSSDRWPRVLPGFRALSLALNPGNLDHWAPSTNAPPAVAQHAAQLCSIASLVCAAAADSSRTSLTYTLPGLWKHRVFVDVASAVASRAAAAVPSDPVRIPGDLAPLPSVSAGDPAGDTIHPSSGADAASSDAAATDGAEDAAASPAVKRRRVDDRRVDMSCDSVAYNITTLSMPPVIAGTDDVPPLLVSLLQIALLLNNPDIDCRCVKPQADGSIVVSIHSTMQDSAAAVPPVGAAEETAGYTVEDVTHTICFPSVLDAARLDAAVSVLVSPDTGEYTDLYERWLATISGKDLITSLWADFPPDFVDTSAMTPRECPADSNPNLIGFHPLFRYHDAFWNSRSMSTLGQHSDALKQLLCHGALAALDHAAWCAFIAVILDAGQQGIAAGLARAIKSMAYSRRSSQRQQETVVLGDMSEMMQFAPDLSLSCIISSLELRAWRKLGAQDPKFLDKAEQAIITFQSTDLTSFIDIVNICSSLITSSQKRALQQMMSSQLPQSLPKHMQFVQGLREGIMLGWLWVSAEWFAVLRLRHSGAARIANAATRVWHPDSVSINWCQSAGVGTPTSLNLPDDHIFLTFPAMQYARAIADAPDATLAHVLDAASKAEHAYSARRRVMGPEIPATRKAFDVLDRLRERAVQLSQQHSGPAS